MPKRTASLRALVKNSILKAHQGSCGISDAISAVAAAEISNALQDSDRLNAVVLDVVRGSIEGLRECGTEISAASEAVAVGVSRTLRKAGANSMDAVRLAAASVIQVATEGGCVLSEAAIEALGGAAGAAARFGAENVDAGSPPGAMSEELGGNIEDGIESHHAEPVRLEPETLTAFTDYLNGAEAEFSRSLSPDGNFLWSDASAEREALIRNGRSLAQYWAGDRPIHVPKGLIHDWIGGTCIAGANIENTLAVMQSYDNHKRIYAPQVIDSKLLSRSGDIFEIYLRLLKRKMITVVLDTDHHVEYAPVTAMRWWCRSHTTRVAEVENAGKRSERSRPPDTGHGFLWRLVSYWRLEKRENGVWIDCRAISLTRDVPKGLGWVIEPMVKKLPRESLLATLEATRRWYGRAK